MSKPIFTSNNEHYQVLVIEREEREYPGSTIPRYELLNTSTGAIEARIANWHMALLLSNEFDRRVEEVKKNGLEDVEETTTGIPVDMDLGSTQH